MRNVSNISKQTVLQDWTTCVVDIPYTSPLVRGDDHVGHDPIRLTFLGLAKFVSEATFWSIWRSILVSNLSSWPSWGVDIFTKLLD